MSDTWHTTRRNVVLAFWTTVLLGIPCWYFTTQVSRAALPIVPRFEQIKPAVSIDVRGISSHSAHKLATGLNFLQGTHQFVNTSEADARYTVEWQEGSAFVSAIQADTRTWSIRSSKAQSQNLEESIAAYMLAIYKDESRRMTSVVDTESEDSDLRVVKYAESYEILVSLMNAGSGRLIKTWNIEHALETTFRPILNDLTPIADFTLESQVQYNADLTFDPVYEESSSHYVLQTSELKNFINSAEWNLASAQSKGKPLNFLVYIPKVEHRPLVIKDKGEIVPTNSFILPQFGSVIIYNPPAESTSDNLEDAVLQHLMEICASHFMILMGLPEVPPAFGEASIWRMDGLLRLRLVEIMVSAQETLKSIPNVVNQIPNMHVPARVAELMKQSLQALETARRHMSSGDVKEALAHAKISVKQAEEAFFDERMVSLLYFPDEHKYGVYMPLFGPLLLPLVMSGIRELRAVMSRKKRTRQEGTVKLKQK